jgi:hypothetical protein
VMIPFGTQGMPLRISLRERTEMRRKANKNYPGTRDSSTCKSFLAELFARALLFKISMTKRLLNMWNAGLRREQLEICYLCFI